MATVYHFTLPYPPSVNRIWRTSSAGKTYKSNEAQAYAWAVVAALSEHNVPCLTGPLAVRLDVYRPRKSGDLDNTAKAILDAMQGRVYVNDSQIIELHMRRFDDKEAPRVEVEVREAT